MIPTSPWSWSKLKLGWRHVPATCFCRPIYGCPWEGWDSTYNHSVDFLPWCRLSTTDQTHLLTMVGLFILFRLRTRGFFSVRKLSLFLMSQPPRRKWIPNPRTASTTRIVSFALPVLIALSISQVVFCATPVSFNQSQTYWPQDDPDHWSYYEDSQAGTMIGKYRFHCSEPNF